MKSPKALAAVAFITMLLMFAMSASAADTTVVITGDTSAGENQPGWIFNRDPSNATPIEFNQDEASIGQGSLYVLPIGSNPADKFIGEYFLNEPIANINSIAYDFLIGSRGTSSDANEFYMNVYANFGESDDLKFYDCRYDILGGVSVVGNFTSVTVDPNHTYPVTTRTGASASPYACPATLADMDALSPGSTIRMFSLNVGDTSASDNGLDGYFDNIVVSLASGTTTFDFEPFMACIFTTAGMTMNLDGDCITRQTIFVPDGYTLVGNGYSITAVDPTAGHFTGAVVQNAGATAHVENLTVRADGLANVCDAGDDRLRGIMFEGASGSISHSTIVDINQGPSGCQEGNAIEVRNEPFDGAHPNTQTVEIAHNELASYQKTGIVANGDVDVAIHHNQVGASATQENLAANSIQLGFGATGSVTHNRVDGNQWLGPSDFAATAILLFDADGPEVSQNNIRGNSDVGIYVQASGATVDNNKVFDQGADGDHGDIGIHDVSGTNTITNNKVKGFDDPYVGVNGGGNKAIGKPSS